MIWGRTSKTTARTGAPKRQQQNNKDWQATVEGMDYGNQQEKPEYDGRQRDSWERLIQISPSRATHSVVADC